MACTVGEILLLPIPSSYIESKLKPWSDIFDSNLNKTESNFTKQNYYGLNASVLTNPSLSKVVNGMHSSDYIVDFENHYFGSSTTFFSLQYFLLTWKTVLDIRADGNKG